MQIYNCNVMVTGPTNYVILVIIKLVFVSLTPPIDFSYQLFLYRLSYRLYFSVLLLNIMIPLHPSQLLGYTSLIGYIVLLRILLWVYRIVENQSHLSTSYCWDSVLLAYLLFVGNRSYDCGVRLKNTYRSAPRSRW